MSAPWIELTETPLHEEHLLLGASYEALEEWLLAAPRTYGDLAVELASIQEGCALCDLSGMTGVLISGEGAEGFVRASCAHGAQAVGECRFGAVVTGDGSVASIPLVARTGDAEYLLWDPTARGMGLLPWLSFLVGIEQDGFRPFADVSVEDVSSSLVPLLLWGPAATSILCDYVHAAEELPRPGEVRQVMLDRIGCLVAAPRIDEQPSYLVLVPPQFARLLWRSFLSFPVVTPIGSSALAQTCSETLPWVRRMLDEARMEMTLSELLEHGLARPEGGFVGARALEV